MRSKTKYRIDAAMVTKLFACAGITDVTEIAPLGAGEYNQVCAVRAGVIDYVLKIAPEESVPVLGYEKNMMQSEVFWYRMMQEHTDITVPHIYYTDFSRNIIPSDWFIMSRLPGTQLDKVEFTGNTKTAAQEMLAGMAARIHGIRSDRFGYIQNGLYDTWDAALQAMTQSLLDDCRRRRRHSRRGNRLLTYIDQYRTVLAGAECCMVNFDIWEPNIICSTQTDGTLSLGWIDPERSFWGDRIADFVCLEVFTPFEEKKISFAAYNRIARSPITVTADEKIRYAIALGYLGLVMETEKYYRYTPFHAGWWRNVFVSSMLYKKAFGTLQA